MGKFIITCLRFLIPPTIAFFTVVILYIVQDPYMDILNHKNYSWKYSFIRIGELSTKKLLKSKVAYNSFVLGSSRSLGAHACYLESKIPKSKFFHYPEWGETIGGIHAKLALIDSLNFRIDNLVIFLDTDCAFIEDGKNRTLHPVFTGKTNLEYIKDHFFLFFSELSMDDLKILLGLTPSLAIFPNWESELETNDAKKSYCEKKKEDPLINEQEYKKRISTIDSLVQSGFFHKRPTSEVYEKGQISQEERLLLIKTKQILEKNHSNFYIIISPLYSQTKFDKVDFSIIKETFGDKVYDYSGINKYTANVYNYYADKKHFQHSVTKEIIDSIIK